MKKIFLLFVIITLFSGCNDGHKKYENTHSASDFLDVQGDYYRDEEQEPQVYICLGDYAHAYHCDDDCMALEQCKGDIEEVSLSDAEDDGRDECDFCIGGQTFYDYDEYYDDDYFF